MTTLIYVEAFGSLRQDANMLNDEEDFYSVFRSRSELMSWATTLQQESILWNINEAELTVDEDSSRIGWVQVDLQTGVAFQTGGSTRQARESGFQPLGFHQDVVEPSVVLPALIQCFYDALQRFGRVELSSIQVSAPFLEPMAESHLNTLVSALNWFNAIQDGNVDALVSFDEDFAKGRSASELVTFLHQRLSRPFRFETAAESSWSRAISVKMPEWSASAAAWVLAFVIDTARASAQSDITAFTVRITRA